MRIMKKRVKHLITLSIVLGGLLSLQAQNQEGKMNDEERIALRPMLMYSPDLSDQDRQILRNKVAQIASNNGLAAAGSEQSFVLTAKALIVEQETIETTPPVTVIRVSVSFYIVDQSNKVIFSSHNISNRGVGNSLEEAIRSSLNQIDPYDARFHVFVKKGKEEILAYYNTQCDLYLEKASTFLEGDTPQKGMKMLMNVPAVSRECYDKAMELARSYSKKLELDKEQFSSETMHAEGVAEDQNESLNWIEN
jgi:hypothetical protein